MSHGERTDGEATAQRTRVYRRRSEVRNKRKPSTKRRRKEKINRKRRKRKERVRGRGETREATAKGVRGGGASPAQRRTGLRRDSRRRLRHSRETRRERDSFSCVLLSRSKRTQIFCAWIRSKDDVNDIRTFPSVALCIVATRAPRNMTDRLQSCERGKCAQKSPQNTLLWTRVKE